jgi:hypothetical protein
MLEEFLFRRLFLILTLVSIGLGCRLGLAGKFSSYLLYRYGAPVGAQKLLKYNFKSFFDVEKEDCPNFLVMD